MNAPIASASLYVGDLHADVTEPMLFEIFSPVGPVASIRVCRDAVTRRSLGYAYVNFHNMVDAERALDTLNYSEIKSQPCRIMWKHRDPSIRKTGLGNVFIKNLDKQLDNRHLNDTFSAFGNIVSCKVATDEQGVSKGYGYVQYETKEEAENAINKVNGMLICDKKVFVGHFVPKQEREKNTSSDNTFTNVFIKNLPEDVEDLKTNFEKFGKITSSVVMKGEDGKSKCFGFVNYETHEAAEKAVTELNGKKIGEKEIYVGRAEKKARREAEMRRKLEQRRAEQQAKYQGVNLYIKNLDDTIDDEKLRTAFKEFGEITSAKVMIDEKNNSKGFGFVCYQTPDEATKAVTGMNGQLLAGKPIYVALHQTREVRRAQLTQQFAQRQGFGNMQRLHMMPNGHMPMFYPPGPGGPQQRPGQVFMFPQGMPPRGQFIHPQMVQMQRQNRNQGRGRGQAGGAQGPQGGQRQQGQGQQRGMKFQPGVVNQRQQNQAGAGGAAPAPAAAAAAPATGQMPELDAKALAAAPAQQQKAMLGEHLYMRIQKGQPALAGKITGMLLELDNTEVLHLIEDANALDAKVNEALAALQSAGQS